MYKLPFGYSATTPSECVAKYNEFSPLVVIVLTAYLNVVTNGTESSNGFFCKTIKPPLFRVADKRCKNVLILNTDSKTSPIQCDGTQILKSTFRL
ncbi:hypothetical protein DPMN_119530 [Dreissena polymorpha]|uniref:Uncharacterized protein n=1 Tax=Dreissena polymorpha TaxID=45954 RepID=A0A9D4GIX2_DREPO|nr:hypothetical protein DPMN_119530 [Dreissena polymorpha]